jgi:hypothetical protein
VPACWSRGPICGRSVDDRKDDFRSVIPGWSTEFGFYLKFCNIVVHVG